MCVGGLLVQMRMCVCLCPSLSTSHQESVATIRMAIDTGHFHTSSLLTKRQSEIESGQGRGEALSNGGEKE